MPSDFDPYREWLEIASRQRPLNHYELLGLPPFESDAAAINAAATKAKTQVQPQVHGQHHDAALRLLAEIAAARRCLLSDKARAAYDAALRRSSGAPAATAAPRAKPAAPWPTGKSPRNQEDYIRCLASSGLLSVEQIRAFIEAAPAGERPTDVESLARYLVRHRKLTRFQAAAIYQGRPNILLFDDYEVLDKVAVGGMGQVFKARHRVLDRLAAIKIPPSRQFGSPAAVRRFRREVEAVARLRHPNIVTAYDAGEKDGIHFLVMEYVDGQDLLAVVRERGPLPLPQALSYVLQAARGLAHAHAAGIIHRDIKPANLLLDRRGVVKVLDLGLAHMEIAAPSSPSDSEEELVGLAHIVGTCDYMAPEQVSGNREGDARSDIYSLGCTLYQLLTGRPPYASQDRRQTFRAHRSAPVPSLLDARDDVPPSVDVVFQRMMAKDPASRQQTTGELIADLERLLASL